MHLTSKQADLILTAVSLIWGSSFVFNKNITALVSPVQMVTLRAAAAALCALVVFLIFIRRATRRELAAGTILGFCLALAGIAQTYGIQITTAGKCAFLTGTNVVMVPFVGWVLTRRRPDGKSVFAAALMFLGVCLLTVNFQELSAFNAGDLYSFLGAFLYAVHIAATGVLTRGNRPTALACIQFMTLFVFSAMFLPFDQQAKTVTWEAVGLAAYLGAVPIFLGHSMQTVCQEKTDSIRAAILLSLEGVFGSLFSAIFLGERYGKLAIFSFALIFISIILSQLDDKALQKLTGRRGIRQSGGGKI